MDVMTFIIIVYFIVLVSLIGGFIYLLKDFNKYKEENKNTNRSTVAKIDSESTDRQTNVSYVVDETNRVNQGMYKELKDDIISAKEDLQYSMEKYGQVIKLTQPQNANDSKPEVTFVSKVNMEDVDVDGLAKVDRLQVGEKLVLGTEGNDMLKVYDTNGRMFGGMNVNNLQVDSTNINKGSSIFKGGYSEHNPNGWSTLLPNTDGRNYIRGDTEIRGNVSSIGDVRMERDEYVRGNQIHSGGNNWIIHSPDDARRTLYIAPSGTYGQMNWDWGSGLELRAAEKQLRLNNGSICINNTCINEQQLALIKSKTGA